MDTYVLHPPHSDDNKRMSYIGMCDYCNCALTSEPTLAIGSSVYHARCFEKKLQGIGESL